MADWAVVLMSGGLDSMVHLHWAQQRWDSNTVALFVDFGHRYVETERQASQKLCDAMSVHLRKRRLPLSDIEQADAFIPLRNMYLLQLATYYADTIVFGALKGENPPDQRPQFFRDMRYLLNGQYRAGPCTEVGRRIHILTPFAWATKTDLLRWYLKHGGDPDLVLQTVGCYNPAGRCGECAACFNRWVALTNCGMSEETARRPWEWALERLREKRVKAISFRSPLVWWRKRGLIWDVYEALRTVGVRPVHEVWEALT